MPHPWSTRPWLVIACAAVLPAAAATLVVRPGDDFSKLEAAQPGDVVLIEPGTYRFRVDLTGRGTAEQPIVFRAADPNSRPVFDLTGRFVEDAPGSYTGGDRGRGCWQVRGGTHYRITGVRFRGCRSASEEGAGLRAVDADGLVLSNLSVSESDHGLFLTGNDITVELSEFLENGSPAALGRQHLLHRGGRVVVRGCTFRRAVNAHSLYLESEDALVEYNVIAEAGLFELQFPGLLVAPRSRLTLRGNLVVQAPAPLNDSQILAFYQGERGGRAIELVASWNTIVGRSGTAPSVLRFANSTFERLDATISNNVFAGTTSPLELEAPALGNATVAGLRNWIQAGAVAPALVDSLSGSEPGFADGGTAPLAQLAHLAPGSPCIGSAALGTAGPPLFEPALGPNGEPAVRRRASAADVGAFAFQSSGALLGALDDPFRTWTSDGGVDGGTGGGADAGASADGGADGGRDAGGSEDAGFGWGADGGGPDAGAWKLRLGCDCTGAGGTGPVAGWGAALALALSAARRFARRASGAGVRRA